jgi:hypothetical protein
MEPQDTPWPSLWVCIRLLLDAHLRSYLGPLRTTRYGGNRGLLAVPRSTPAPAELLLLLAALGWLLLLLVEAGPGLAASSGCCFPLSARCKPPQSPPSPVNQVQAVRP